jgi:uncharacterized membrane protein YeaQ/YmgE (transglycosylase-associated protein family)
VTLQTLLLAFSLATLYGAGFHLVQGGGSRRLALYLLAGWLGFTLGHFVGDALGITVLKVGALNMFSASVGSLVALLAARWLATSDALTPQK